MAYPRSRDRPSPTPHRCPKPWWDPHHSQYLLKTPACPALTQTIVSPMPCPSEPASAHFLLTQDNFLPPAVDLLAPSTTCLYLTRICLLRASTQS